MFPGRYFAKAYFPGRYFEPVEGVMPPVKPPEHHGGSRQRWRRTDEILRDWRIEQDDEELMFWIE